MIKIKPNMDNEWLQRRWFEFRSGYTTYLTFFFGFSNFLLILYGLTDWFSKIPFHIFALMFIGIILPSAIIVGNLHIKKQVPVEGKVATYQHGYRDKIVPDSKETFSIKFSIFTTEHQIWHMNLTKLNMKLLNALLDQVHAPKELRYDQKLFDELEDFQNKFTQWREKFVRYSQGEDASKVSNE